MSDKCKHGVEMATVCRDCDDDERHYAESSLAAPQGSADFWCVRFETNEGHSHPIWYGEKGGKQWPKEDIQRLAEAYLKENSHWLKSIDDIYPPNDQAHRLPPTATVERKGSDEIKSKA